MLMTSGDATHSTLSLRGGEAQERATLFGLNGDVLRAEPQFDLLKLRSFSGLGIRGG